MTIKSCEFALAAVVADKAGSVTCSSALASGSTLPSGSSLAPLVAASVTTGRGSCRCCSAGSRSSCGRGATGIATGVSARIAASTTIADNEFGAVVLRATSKEG